MSVLRRWLHRATVVVFHDARPGPPPEISVKSGSATDGVFSGAVQQQQQPSAFVARRGEVARFVDEHGGGGGYC